MDQPEHHSRALEINRKEVGWAAKGSWVWAGAQGRPVCVPRGFTHWWLCAHLGVQHQNTWPRVHRAGAALTSLMGQFGLQPGLSQEFRGPLSQRFEEDSGFCIPGRIKPEG